MSIPEKLGNHNKELELTGLGKDQFYKVFKGAGRSFVSVDPMDVNGPYVMDRVAALECM